MNLPRNPTDNPAPEGELPLSGSLERLYASVLAAKNRDPAISRTAKLLSEGKPKMAKKLVEEAAEAALDAVTGQRGGVIMENADLLYNLCVLWAACDIAPADVTAEIIRRERAYGIAEKLPKGAAAQAVKGWDVTP
jgi:phosphoribosyl-ATP pyrophosphohydrolase